MRRPRHIRLLALLLAIWSSPALAQDVTRVTVLVDAFSDRAGLRMDWGYSALVEHRGRRVLFDAGNNAGLFQHNVDVLGLDLRNLDFVVISHRHGDHTDGLKYLLSINPGVAVYAANDEYFGGPTPSQFFARPVPTLPDRMRYFNGVVPDLVPHGSPWSHAHTQRVTAALDLAPGIRVVPNISSGKSFSETPELSLVLDTPGGQVLLVGCSHPGIETILESVDARTRPVRLLVGGLHLVTTTDAEISQLVERLDSHWKIQSIAPGHCTGEHAFALLSQRFGGRYHYAGVGTVLRVDPEEP
jgi:7,8-dihydropterin-6-yl-methyl-4-(beta-D-ribofuranosyl)aminobenzene 5'-phosphate synthase